MGSITFHHIGFVGLGAMGKPMAEQLATKLPAGSQMRVFDVMDAAMDELVTKYPGRMVRGSSPKDVAEHAEILITMVPEGSHVRSVYLDAETGISSANISQRLVLLDCSTIDTATSLAVSAQMQCQHPTTTFYDAPVSGGVLGAERGTIAFFLGCSTSDANLPMLTTLLSLMGTQVIPCGGPSLGLTAKLCNNYLSGLIAIASSDAMNIAMANGLDPRVFNRVVSAGTGQNTICDRFNPVPGVVAEAPSSHGYRNGFKVQLMRKDFGLAVDMAERSGVELVLGEAGLRTYQAAAEDERCRDLDSRVVFRWMGGDEAWREKFDAS